jgi:hypothetical protein
MGSIKMLEANFRALVVLAVSVSALQAGAPEWDRKIVDAGGGGKFSTLLFDKSGNAQVSYINDEAHLLKYAFWDRKLDKWFLMTLDDKAGGFSSMVLDSKQQAHISYLEYGTGRLRYAHWNGSRWQSETIKLSARLLEFYTSITVDADDQPTLSFYEVVDAEGVNMRLNLRAARWTGQAWEVGTIDGTKGSGKFNFLMSRPDGRPAVAYANVRDENASLRFAGWDGARWKVEIIEGAKAAFYVYNVSGVADSAGAPHIAYTDVRNLRVKYATIRDRKWVMETVGTVAKEGYPDRNGIALDENGAPYVSYYDAARGELRVAHKEGAQWKSELVDDDFAGFTSSIKIDHGQIFLTYYDISHFSLKCARRPLASGPETAPVKPTGPVQ